jgi:hypothetical protein
MLKTGSKMFLDKALSTARKLKLSKRKRKMRNLRKRPGPDFSNQTKITIRMVLTPKKTPCLGLTFNRNPKPPN